MANSLLVAPPGRPAVPPDLVRGVRLVPFEGDDVGRVGEVYWLAFGGPAAETTLEEAVADVERFLAGGYGTPLAEACWVARSTGGGGIVGAVLCVRDAPWPDVPPGPFVTDLFVVPGWRRRGLGRALMVAAMATAPHESWRLRVEDDNVAALTLYATLGFRRER